MAKAVKKTKPEEKPTPKKQRGEMTSAEKKVYDTKMYPEKHLHDK